MNNFFRKSAKIYKWILISVIIQFLVLLFINNVFLVKKVDRDSMNMSEYEESNKSHDLRKGEIIKLALPDGATECKVSFDGSHTAFLKDNKIEIINLESKVNVYTMDNSFLAVDRIRDRQSFDAVISYFEWLNDRNTLIYSVHAPDTEDGVVQLATYNIETDRLHGFPPAMYKLPSGSKAVDIKYSTKTNVIYMKVKTNANVADIYRYNILDQISYVFSTDSSISFFKFSLTDHFVFQDKKNNLSVWDGEISEIIPLSIEKSIMLLGVGDNDYIFVGEIDADSVIKIYYGKFDQPFLEWNSMDPGKPISKDNILTTDSGKIFELNRNLHCLYEIPSNKKIEFTGEFLYVTDKFIISTENNELLAYQYK